MEEDAAEGDGGGFRTMKIGFGSGLGLTPSNGEEIPIVIIRLNEDEEPVEEF